MVQRQDAAARADLDALGAGGEGGGAEGGVGVEAAEGVEVPLRRPHRLETVAIGETCAFEQQTVLVLRVRRVVVREVEQAEAGAGTRLGALAVQHHRKAARQGPEDFEYRDVEGQARRREPGAGGVVRDAGIHAGAEIDEVAMGDRHTLGPAGRTGRVDDIGEILPAGATGGRRGLAAGLRGVEHLRRSEGEAILDGAARQQDLGARIFEHVGEALARIVGIEGQVGRTGLQGRKDGDDEVRHPLVADADDGPRPDSSRDEAAGELPGGAIELAIGEAGLPGDDGVPLGQLGRPGGDLVLDRAIVRGKAGWWR